MNPPDATLSAPPPRRRGRPALCWWSLAEVAEELGLQEAFLAALLDRLPGALPGAERHEAHGWVVPSTTVRSLRLPRRGLDLVPMATIDEVCQAMRRSKSVVYRWCTEQGPDGKPLLRARKVMGQWLIEIPSLWDLPAKCPAWAASPFLVKRSAAKRSLEEVPA